MSVAPITWWKQFHAHVSLLESLRCADGGEPFDIELCVEGIFHFKQAY